MHLVYSALLYIDQRRQFRQQHAAHRDEVPLSLKHSRELRKVGFQPVLLLVALRCPAQVVDHGVDVIFQVGHLTASFHLNRARQVAFRHCRRHFGDGAHLVGQIRGKQVDVAGQVFPSPGGTRHVCLSAQAALHTDFARDVGDLFGERCQRIGHVVDGLRQRRDFTLGHHGQLLAQATLGDCGHDFHDATYLVRQVCRHDVHRVGQVLPRSGDAGNLRLAAQLALGADLAGDTRDLCGERAQLIDHRVDRVL